ncbi:MAG TPA: cyclic nucleotide-binding domain-containing protein, partial [Acidimicrobiia bacterium]|nr:cyclic nucleotide-binding domain-containing protein [Acidimicrobiia bacterium]
MTVATNDDEALFPVLSPEQLALLEPFGTRRSIAPGDVLFAEGDASYDFFVVLSGLVDILGHFDGEDVLIAQHGVGR